MEHMKSDQKTSDAAEMRFPHIGTSSGDPHEMPRPPLLPRLLAFDCLKILYAPFMNRWCFPNLWQKILHPLYISLPTIHGGEILQRIFFIGLPGHCFICGRKGHMAADCTRRRAQPLQRQAAMDLEQGQQCLAVAEDSAGLPNNGKQRSEAERARMRVAKKRRRKHVWISENLRVVYRRKVRSPTSLDIPSTSEPPPASLEPPPSLPTILQQCSSSFSEGESFSYEESFPTLLNACKETPIKKLRRSTRKKKGKS